MDVHELLSIYDVMILQISNVTRKKPTRKAGSVSLLLARDYTHGVHWVLRPDFVSGSRHPKEASILRVNNCKTVLKPPI